MITFKDQNIWINFRRVKYHRYFNHHHLSQNHAHSFLTPLCLDYLSPIQVKAYNAELAQKVQTLSKRIDGRLSNGASASNTKRNSGIFPDYDMQDGRLSHETEEDRVDYEEMKRLREKVSFLVIFCFIHRYER